MDEGKLNKSASKWTKTDLAKLGVDYRHDRFDEMMFGQDDVPPTLLQGNLKVFL
jgi:hypothetical protein